MSHLALPLPPGLTLVGALAYTRSCCPSAIHRPLTTKDPSFLSSSSFLAPNPPQARSKGIPGSLIPIPTSAPEKHALRIKPQAVFSSASPTRHMELKEAHKAVRIQSVSPPHQATALCASLKQQQFFRDSNLVLSPLKSCAASVQGEALILHTSMQ